VAEKCLRRNLRRNPIVNGLQLKPISFVKYKVGPLLVDTEVGPTKSTWKVVLMAFVCLFGGKKESCDAQEKNNTIFLLCFVFSKGEVDLR